MKLSKLSSNNQYIIAFILGALILVIYGINIKNIYTVWQIGDEAGYLMNAAFLTNHDWSSIYNVIPYYGYGYSLLLIPLFILFGTGIEIIQGAVFINILCITITYFIQIVVMKIITKDTRVHILALISFTTCFYPYIVGQAFQVIAESFLIMLFWTSILLLCKAVEKQNIYIYILYSFFLAYMFFVHARAIMVIAAAFITLLICVFLKKIKLRHSIVFICTFFLFFIIGSSIKKYIINSVYTGVTTKGELENRNIITITYILDRIKWLFNYKNIQMYIHGFFAKLFYALVSTSAMIAFGIIFLYKKFINKNNELNCMQLSSMLYIFFSFFLMFLASCVNGTGISENFTYFFYGRYFEYTMLPLIFFGIYTYVSYRLNAKEIGIIILLCLISGIMSSNIITVLDSNEIHIDVYRIAGFSYGIKVNNNFESLIFYLTLLIILVTVSAFLLHSVLKLKTVIILLVLIYFFNINTACIDTINTTNRNSIMDLEIAEYINNIEVNDYVYFIDEEFRYYGFYSRMQVLMPRVQMKVIQMDQLKLLNPDSLVITYKDTSSDTLLSNLNEPLLTGSIFNLYEIQ